MSVLERLFQPPRSDPSQGAAPADNDMREVLETFLEMNPQPLQTLTPEAARVQPTVADAAMVILRRRGVDRRADLGIESRDITLEGATGPLPARIYNGGAAGEAKPVVVYFHGGGFVIADLDDYDATPRAIAKFADCIVVSCHYRQAPEHRFPAAHDDAFAAWRWVVAHSLTFGGDPHRVAVLGESAGGNLAAAVAMMARDSGERGPVHMGLVYPLAGVDMATPSYEANAAALPLSRATMQWFVGHAFESPEQARADPRINLVAADLAGLPAATVITAQIDPLCSEGETLARRLSEQGVEVRHKTFHGVTHDFFGLGLVVKDALAAEIFMAHELKRAFGTALPPL